MVRFSNVFFYNPLYQPSVFQDFFLKDGIKVKHDQSLLVIKAVAAGQSALNSAVF